MEQPRLDLGQEPGRALADDPGAIAGPDRERGRQRPEFGDQRRGPGGGIGGPGGPEERVQERSAPLRFMR
jgi:hypothetical protein